MPSQPLVFENYPACPVTVRSPSSLPSPHWLKEGDYDSPQWVVIDDNPKSPRPERRIRWDVQVYDPRRPTEFCRLTDPEYANLLDTSKRQSYLLRVGKYATVTTAYVHEEMSRAIINWDLWLILNSIYRYSDLDDEDYAVYAEGAVYGPGFLLQFAPRLISFIKSLKEGNEVMPSIKRPRMRLALDTTKLLSAAGIDPRKGFLDSATTYEIAKLAAAEGFILFPAQLKRLKQGPTPLHRNRDLNVLRTLQPWDSQWRMRDQLPGDKIQFNPFAERTLLQVAEELGETVGRTKTAPIKQTMELIDRSIRWVLEYAPVLLDARDKWFEVFNLCLPWQERRRRLVDILDAVVMPAGQARPFPLHASTKESKATELDFGTAVNCFIPAACAVVISAFTGRRHQEVLSLRAAGSANDHCISSDERGLWLEAYIEKTCQDWVKTPCTEIVAAAVMILDRWSAPARAASGENGLFQLKRLSHQGSARFYLGDALRDFCEFIDLPNLLDGSQWRFTPHQFRRFFAIMYFWHYKYRNLGALSYHLRHIDPAVTQIYLTERETGAIFEQVNKHHTLTIFSETAFGELNLSGPFGERFKRTAINLYRRYRRTTKVITQSLIDKTIDRFVTKTGRRLKAMMWGYCACGTTPSQLATARCVKHSDKSTSGPDFGNSSPTVCCSCPHHATEEVFEPFLQDQIEFHSRAAADPKNGPILRAASREHVKLLRAHCKRSFQDAKPVRISNGKPSH